MNHPHARPRRRTALAGLALIGTTAGLVPAARVAAEPMPPAATAPEAAGTPGQSLPAELAELARLSREAEALGEVLHTAQADRDRAAAGRDDADRAAGVAAARAAVADLDAARSQGEVDSLANRRYRGGGVDAPRAAVLAQNPRDLIDRLGALSALADATTVDLDAATRSAGDAARLRAEAGARAAAARTAADEAAARESDLARRTAELQGRTDEVRRRVDTLTEQERAQWVGRAAGAAPGPEVYALPGVVDGANSAAVRAGLTRIGRPYSWGATGPDAFDCSGLMLWSYQQAGKTLPRSSQMQAAGGAAVARDDLQPGDLVVYYPGGTHVGMYVGEGKVLHAPDYGIPVTLAPVDSMPIVAMRRY